MPSSYRENDADVRAFVAEHDIQSALDVGPGVGTYSRILGDLIPVMDAVEVWKPYIGKYDLENKYRTVTNADIREHGNFDYDLVIFGDCLEHMTRDESLAVWQRTSEQARFGLISVPIIHYKQGALQGNPYEIHRQEHLTPEAVAADYGPFAASWLYKVTGTFCRKFQ